MFPTLCSMLALVQQQQQVRLHCPPGFQRATTGKALTVKYMMVLMPAACCSTCNPTPATPPLSFFQLSHSTGIASPYILNPKGSQVPNRASHWRGSAASTLAFGQAYMQADC